MRSILKGRVGQPRNLILSWSSRPGLLKISDLGPVLAKDMKTGEMHVSAYPQNSFPPDAHK